MDIYPTRKMSEPAFIFRRDPVVYGAPEGPLDAQNLKCYDESGYLTVEGLFGTAEVERYREELVRLSADDKLKRDDRTVLEPGSGEVRSIFEVHKISEVFAELVSDPRLVGRARQILGSDVYVHQSRVNHKPGFQDTDYYWHSDFETWHAEDGMPRMRAVSVSIALADNTVCNGGMMIMPGSHRTFVSCLGETPTRNYWEALRNRKVGTPDPDSLKMLADRYGIELLTGPAGSATMFDCNCMYGSNGNITPFPRSNICIGFNSVENTCTQPYAATERRPAFIGARDFTPVG